MLILGLIQSLISSAVFFFRRPRHLSNKLLSVWLAIIALSFLGMLLPEGMVAYLKTGFLPLVFLYGPLLFFYVKSLISGHFSFQWRHAWHLLPFLTLSILRTFIYPESFEYDHYLSGTLNPAGSAIIFFLFASLIGYWLATLFLLTHHRKNLLNHFSYRSKKLALDWIWLIMLLFILNQLIGSFAPFLKDYFRDPQEAVFWLFQFNLGIFMYLLTIFGLLQPVIFPADEKVEAPDIPSEKETASGKYHRSGLSEEQLQQLSAQIKQYLQTQKPYLNPEYSLQLMSEDLDLSRQNLSQTINEVFGKNFYQLINAYRVEEVKRLLQSPQSDRLTMEGLAYEAGFNSKASFYRVFKEFTGRTPAAYKGTLAQRNG